MIVLSRAAIVFLIAASGCSTGDALEEGGFWDGFLRFDAVIGAPTGPVEQCEAPDELAGASREHLSFSVYRLLDAEFLNVSSMAAGPSEIEFTQHQELTVVVYEPSSEPWLEKVRGLFSGREEQLRKEEANFFAIGAKAEHADDIPLLEGVEGDVFRELKDQVIASCAPLLPASGNVVYSMSETISVGAVSDESAWLVARSDGAGDTTTHVSNRWCRKNYDDGLMSLREHGDFRGDSISGCRDPINEWY